MLYKGFIIGYWCGIYHATNGTKKMSAAREADIYSMIDNYLN